MTDAERTAQGKAWSVAEGGSSSRRPIHYTAFTVLWKLGLLSTAVALADPDADEHGRILEAARRPKRVRNPVDSDSDNDF